jgi:hypothetical protein
MHPKHACLATILALVSCKSPEILLADKVLGEDRSPNLSAQSIEFPNGKDSIPLEAVWDEQRGIVIKFLSDLYRIEGKSVVEEKDLPHGECASERLDIRDGHAVAILRCRGDERQIVLRGNAPPWWQTVIPYALYSTEPGPNENVRISTEVEDFTPSSDGVWLLRSASTNTSKDGEMFELKPSHQQDSVSVLTPTGPDAQTIDLSKPKELAPIGHRVAKFVTTEKHGVSVYREFYSQPRLHYCVHNVSNGSGACGGQEAAKIFSEVMDVSPTLEMWRWGVLDEQLFTTDRPGLFRRKEESALQRWQLEHQGTELTMKKTGAVDVPKGQYFTQFLRVGSRVFFSAGDPETCRIYEIGATGSTLTEVAHMRAIDSREFCPGLFVGEGNKLHAVYWLSSEELFLLTVAL